jgi:hypothetical protein
MSYRQDRHLGPGLFFLIGLCLLITWLMQQLYL